MCGHVGERMVKAWILNDKGEKEPVTFLVDGYEPELTQCINVMYVIGMAYMFKEPYKKKTKEI